MENPVENPQASPHPATPVRITLRPWHWFILAAALLTLAAGLTWYWKHQADTARAELRQTLAALPAMSRPALQRAWGAKVDWTPAPDTPEALAVLPRTPYLTFDAIYVVYRGERVAATLALTSIGGYFNNEPLDWHQHPQTLISRPLSAGERADLALLIRLLEQRLSRLDPQTDRYAWTRDVLDLARRLAG